MEHGSLGQFHSKEHVKGMLKDAKHMLAETKQEARLQQQQGQGGEGRSGREGQLQGHRALEAEAAGSGSKARGGLKTGAKGELKAEVEVVAGKGAKAKGELKTEVVAGSGKAERDNGKGKGRGVL